MKRQRGRGRKPSGGQQNRNFESSGPDIKIRGSASHVYDKYQQLARDAASAGDRIAAESYLQHAEHYFRVMRVQQQQQQQYARDRGDESPREGESHAGGQNGGQPAQGGQPRQAPQRGSDDAGARANGAEANPLEVVDPEANGAAGAEADVEGENKPRRPRRRRRTAEDGDEASSNSETLDRAASS